jgi:hypothetical protein
VAVYNADYDVTVLYLHCEDIEVRRGDVVEAGDVIGLEGNKGSGSPYTHVEMRKGRHTSSNTYRDINVESDCPYPVMLSALEVTESGRQPATAAAVAAAQRMREEAENGVVDEKIVLKLFKNLLLEDLKQASPRVELKFPLFDGIKIGGGFAGASGIAVVKALFGFTGSVLLFVTCLLPIFLLYMLKSAFGFINRRTSYLQQYSSSLYFQTLASNRAAISLLVSLAEDQEVKEIVLGYFAASKFATWTPEKPIDLVAETWLADKFGVDVDFESDDAIRKLLEKRLIERRENENGELEYRAVSLDEALRRLEVDWNALVVAPLGDAA